MPHPLRHREPAELLGQSPNLQRPLWVRGSWGHRREAGEIRRGRQEEPSGTGGVVEEWRAFAPPTQAQEVCWVPR